MEILASQIAVATERAQLYEVVERGLSERKQADLALQDSEKRFRSIADTASNAIIIFA